MSNYNHMRPIFEVMKENNLIEHRMFSLCLGKNGGYFQIGGFDKQGHLEEVKWANMFQNYSLSYKINLEGVSLNGHLIKGSSKFYIGSIDSGTTFAQFPDELIRMMASHLDWYCTLDFKNNCKG